MHTPTWISRTLVEAFHYMQLDEHGGAHRVRDGNALESVLARLQSRHHYDPAADLATLAAAYAFGIATSHPFVDGNKRTAFLVAAALLDLNGYEVGFTDEDVVDMMLRLADHKASEEDVAGWFRGAMRRFPPPDDVAEVAVE